MRAMETSKRVINRVTSEHPIVNRTMKFSKTILVFREHCVTHFGFRIYTWKKSVKF